MCIRDRNTDVPALASNPPTIPGISAGLSAIAIAIYPARIGNIMPNAVSVSYTHLIDSVSLCSLFSNTLDNAIEASLKIREPVARKTSV